ncbi:uncharacterized protein LOC116614146 [Nematostella vectensis]|uniref:uncharacterized protein LOC116614146 n=1 Tax=Nematostella vectensis TaxID=45351 RepID=UPI002076EDD2|nr:uncharacterized protein LOC116614146 [Nematostella vectensis]
MAAVMSVCRFGRFQRNIFSRLRREEVLTIHVLKSRLPSSVCQTRCFNTGRSKLKNLSEPIAFSKSRAKHHKIDDTLGITKEKKSNIPLYVGLVFFAVIVYLGFLRQEDPLVIESFEQALERARIQHEERNTKSP